MVSSTFFKHKQVSLLPGEQKVQVSDTTKAATKKLQPEPKKNLNK